MKLIRKLRERLITLRVKLVKEPEWVSVYQSHEEYSVYIRKLKLESEGIPTMIFDQRDSSYNAFGFVFLHVRVGQLEQAKQVLTETNE